ncbi:MAG: VanZ family protein [Peptoniphilus sp.]|nr:VanZ family protein [Peptoniphilus sp.]MDY3118147.1 VanZ family protein [Peptoniphilus sp.]
MIAYVVKMTPVVVFISFFSFSFLRAQLFSKQKKKSNRKRERLLLVFATYCLWLLFFLFVDNRRLEDAGVLLGIDTSLADWKINLTPFATVRTFWRYGSFTGMFLNIFGNVLIAVLPGFLTPLLFRRFQKLPPTFLLYGGLFFLVEILQYFTGRSADIDDWLLNMSGILLGYFLSKKQRAFSPKIYRR